MKKVIFKGGPEFYMIGGERRQCLCVDDAREKSGVTLYSVIGRH